MPDTKTSEETAAGALDGTELHRLVQGGNSRKATLAAEKVYFDGGFEGLSADADFTIQIGVNAKHLRHTGTLTADRAVTVSTTDAYAGAGFWFTRMSGGAFNLNFDTTPALALAQNDSAYIAFNGTFWYPAFKGSV